MRALRILFICLSIAQGAQCVHALEEARDLERFQYTEVHMGMQARIVLYAPSEQQAREAARLAFARIAELNDIFSDYQPDSELIRLCSRAGEGPVKVSPELFAVLEMAQRISEHSAGAFDVTAGPYVRLWREARREGRIPSLRSLREARPKVGWRLMRLDAERQTVELKAPGMLLDLGGIAKGRALDEALRVLREQGLGHALVEMGGDIALGERPPGAEGWRLEVAGGAGCEELPRLLSNCGVSSSGDTEQYVEYMGRRYSHVVDPRTSMALSSRTLVTVVARNAELSDALSTALGVLGEEDADRLLPHYPQVQACIRKAPTSAGDATEALRQQPAKGLQPAVPPGSIPSRRAARYM